jgi:hypothetical protein
MTIDIEKLISDVNLIDDDQREALLLLLLKKHRESASTDVYRDIVPVDILIEPIKDEKTGILCIRFPYSVGVQPQLYWRELEITMAAQKVLLNAIEESIAADEKAGRTPPKSVTIQ